MESGREDGGEVGDADERKDQMSRRMHDALKKHFGYTAFRGRQEQAIRTVLKGEKPFICSFSFRAFTRMQREKLQILQAGRSQLLNAGASPPHLAV